MTPRLLFVHGWAMDGSIWHAVREWLDAWSVPEQAISVREMGYLEVAGIDDGEACLAAAGAPAPPPAPVLAVGHSLGVMQLLAAPPAGLAGLVSINGFTRFSAAADHPAGVPRRILQRMLRRLEEDPAAAVAAFRQGCGIVARAPAPLLPALRRGLELLRDGDARPLLPRLSVPVLALAGTRDAVVPPALSAACFADPRWVEGGHLLPLTHPELCARALLELAGEIAGSGRG